MNPTHEQLSSLFLELRRLPPPAREARLIEIRVTTPSLAEDVESMLRHDEDPPEILRTGAAGIPPSEPPPEWIGPYRVLSTLGEGGMGAVYLAEQEEPLRRRVAVKIVRSGSGAASALMRFEIERQVLARLSHPNVARVFEAGTTEAGQPYFAMELVNGPAITEHCDRGRLPVRARLELFLQVCAGVHHAHQNAILHRDLKPGNVLVEVDGSRATPKVIDFGVAKALDLAPDAPSGARTRKGQILGTPPYMSPEQVAAAEGGVDVRSDVYSLGAILYELLCGAPPVDLEGIDPLDVAGIRRRVHQAAPVPPSRRIASQPPSVAACRAGSLERLQRTFRGDLDGIVLKALRRDPADRYGSVPELADDLRRYLNHEPVRAVPQGWASRLWKGVRRNKAGASFVALLLVVAIVTSILAWRLAVARSQAETAQRSAEEYARFLLHGYDLMGLSNTRSAFVDPAKLLDRASQNLERLPAQPETRARLLRAIGDAHVRVGRLDEGRRILDLAWDAASLLGPEDLLQVLEVRASRAFLAFREARWSESESALRDVITRAAELGNAGPLLRVEARRDLIRLLLDANRGSEALVEMERQLEQISAELGPEDPETLVAASFLASIEGFERLFRRQAARLDELIPRMERVLGSRHEEVLIAYYNHACSLANLGEPEKAIQNLDLAVDRGLAILHNLAADPDLAPLRDDPRFRGIVERHVLNLTVAGGGMDGSWLERVGLRDRDLAVALAQDLLAAGERVFGAGHPANQGGEYHLAETNLSAGRYTEAEAIYRRLLGIHRPDPSARPADLDGIANLHWGIAECRFGLGDRDEALRELKRAEDLFDMAGARTSDVLAHVRASRLLLLGDRAGALREIRTALRLAPLSRFAPEKDVILRGLRDEPEFRAILAAERHPYAMY